MRRREFVNWVGLGLISSYLPVALIACTKDNTVANDTSDASASASEPLSVGTVEQLEENGFLLDEESKVLVIKDNAGKLMAVNPTCTHQGCTVEWKADSSTFVCPCHNAKFSSGGKVLGEPAKSPLPTYEVKEENRAILVNVT